MKKTLYILILALIFVSCEKVIEFKGEVTEPMIVVSSFITPDSTISAHLSKSRFFLENSVQHYLIENAEFKLIINGEAKGKLLYQGNGFYNSPIKPRIGDEVKFEISAPGFDPASSTTKIPERVPLISVDTTSTIETGYQIYDNPNGGTDTISYHKIRKMNFRVKFKDNGNQKNYYRLLVALETTSNGNPITTYLSKFDDIIFGNQSENSGVQGVFDISNSNYSFDTFSDELINGKEYEIKIQSDIVLESSYFEDSPFYYDGLQSYEFSKEKYKFYLQQISPEYYFYAKSFAAARNTNGNPFVEPVQIHSNIQDGIGLLGSYTSSEPIIIEINN